VTDPGQPREDADVEEVAGVIAPEPASLPALGGSRELARPAASPAMQAAAVAATGLVAGAATVVAVRRVRTRGMPSVRRSRRSRKPAAIVASRSFLVDVHLLDRG
jgi:hypothetical protein